MTDDMKGTPLAAAHLRPELRQKAGVLTDGAKEDEPQRPPVWLTEPGRYYLPGLSEKDFDTLTTGLSKLREPFAPDQIEKLPKPTWKGAWADKRGSHCPVCNGYHVLENCIHLDYVGHANATNRLLDADLAWNWEPLSWTEEGTPRFSDGGLWIKLTVCGVTRLGFGDGSSVKEVIGDAIRNAAMRFGVALDLWAKINLHEERNPGDGQTRSSGRGPRDGAGDQNAGRSARTHGGQGRASDSQGTADAAPAENQDALDALASVCDAHGYDRRTMGSLFRSFADEYPDGQLTPLGLIDASSEHILMFADELVARAESDPRVGGESGAGLSADSDGLAPDEDGPTTGLEGSGGGPGGPGGTEGAAVDPDNPEGMF